MAHSIFQLGTYKQQKMADAGSELPGGANNNIII